MKKIVYIPLDERPCNYDFAHKLSLNNDSFFLVRPDESLLGFKKTPAKYNLIADFIRTECADADYLIIALDTLLYGGIIPSRLHNLDIDDIVARLNVINEIKKQNPTLKIFAFSLIMRCPCYSDNAEEPDYYATCGREIFLYGQNEHKYRDGIITKEEYLKVKEDLKVCEEYLNDYVTRREKNLVVFLKMVDMIGASIDEFVILQDDSNKFGYTAMDQERIKAAIDARACNVLIYPGADEGGMTMLSRAVCHINGKSPKIYPVFPTPSDAQITPMYEDREVFKSVRAQIKSAGGVLCEEEDEADILLFCNISKTKLFDIAHEFPKGQDDSYIPSFVDKMKLMLNNNKGVAVADIAYCNGGDLTLAKEISKKIGFLNLWGYSGWNTSSNTLGTVICQSVIRYLHGDTQTHRDFTALRVFEDVCYYADVRHELRLTVKDRFGTEYTYVGDKAVEISDAIIPLVLNSASVNSPEIADCYTIRACSLPWKRIFEIRIDISKM